MTLKIERNRNINDTPTDGILTMTGDVAEDFIPANPDRIELTVSVRDENGWLRRSEASVDPAVRTGIFMVKGITRVLDRDIVYTGAYSVINDKNGKFPTFHFTEL